MKILHIIQSLSLADGGPPQSVRNIMQVAPIAGLQPEVLCQDEPGAPFLEQVAAPVHAIGGRTVRFGYSPRLRQWLGEHASRFDGIVLHGIWSYTNVAVHRAARQFNIPYAVFPHGALDPWFNRRYPLKRLKKNLFWRWQYPVLRDAVAVLFTTAQESELAVTSFQPSRWNGMTVPYGTVGPVGDPAAHTAALYAKLPQLQGRRYLLFLARIHEKKGCDLLLDAFAARAARMPDLDLVIAGPDQVGLQAKLQHRAAAGGIAARVHWPGMLTGDAKWGALRHCDAFVLPSHQENFGIAVSEALACGRPVLISNQVNLWPDVVADNTGLVEPDTLEGTGRLLDRWFALTPGERSAYPERALRAFHARYSTTETARTIRRLFDATRNRNDNSYVTV